jgi:hypothetical protein
MLGTPLSVLEDDDDRNDDYEQQADEMVQKVWQIFQDDQGWSQEAKSTDGSDVVFSKIYPKCGKVFRLSVIVDAHARSNS